jgi:hypothetical protein
MAYWWGIGRSTGRLVHALNAYWSDKCAGRPMPARPDIEPSEIKHLLPNLLIIDLEAEPFRVRYRLLGTKVVVASGRDFTGAYLDELIPGDVEDQWETCYRLVWGERRPLFGDCTVPTLGGDSFTYEFAIFPLGAGAAVTQCVSIEDYGPLNDRLFELQKAAQPWQPRGIKPKKPDTD